LGERGSADWRVGLGHLVLIAIGSKTGLTRFDILIALRVRAEIGKLSWADFKMRAYEDLSRQSSIIVNRKN
jgi:hypothetical protein